MSKANTLFDFDILLHLKGASILRGANQVHPQFEGELHTRPLVEPYHFSDIY